MTNRDKAALVAIDFMLHRRESFASSQVSARPGDPIQIPAAIERWWVKPGIGSALAASLFSAGREGAAA
jgi:NADPH-dependent ferric siderophore reductase